MAGILMQEKINELPVVDDDMHIVGQINIYEVIMVYLQEIRQKQVVIQEIEDETY
jgi:predicted transcriptional regulator